MIAIHHRAGSFSKKWIEYCKDNNIEYKLVDCYSSDIIKQLKNCKGLMWHWVQWDVKAILFARQLTYSLEKKGIRVFPNSDTCWHFDDKIGQKYLLEAINAPFVKSYVFYDKDEALNWANNTSYPKVFKLRGGAGALNVKLVNNKRKASKLIRKAFGSGFSHVNNLEKVKDRWGKLNRKKDWNAFYSLLRGVGLFVYPRLDSSHKLKNREKGYIYFQEFIPNNNYDIRVIVIGGKAFAIKRMVRHNDFRASGSGILDHRQESIPLDAVKMSFETSQKLNSQSLAVDYVLKDGEPLIVEMSYGFPLGEFVDSCPGYWDSTLNWHEGNFIPEHFMIEEFVQSLGIN